MIAIPIGLVPTVIGVPRHGGVEHVAVGVSVIGMTLFPVKLVTYAVCPFGVTAMPSAWVSPPIGVPATSVAVLIGVTLPEPLAVT